jgi:hypothetical protein
VDSGARRAYYPVCGAPETSKSLILFDIAALEPEFLISSILAGPKLMSSAGALWGAFAGSPIRPGRAAAVPSLAAHRKPECSTLYATLVREMQIHPRPILLWRVVGLSGRVDLLSYPFSRP